MDQKYRKLLLRWTIPALLVLFFLIKVINEPQILVTYVITGLIIGLVIYFFIIGQAESIVKRRLRQPTPHKALRYYEPTLQLKDSPVIPGSDFIQSYYKSLILCFYGEYESALGELNQHDLSDLPKIYEAMRLNGIVVSKYLQKIDLKNALSSARESLLLSKYPKLVSGQKKIPRNNYEAYVEIGEILNGMADENTIIRLERRFSRATLFPKLMIAWGLGRYYQSNGEKKKAEEMKRFLEKTVPFCDPLRDS